LEQKCLSLMINLLTCRNPFWSQVFWNQYPAGECQAVPGRNPFWSQVFWNRSITFLSQVGAPSRNPFWSQVFWNKGRVHYYAESVEVAIPSEVRSFGTYIVFCLWVL